MNSFYILTLLIALLAIYGMFFTKREKLKSPTIEEFTEKIKSMTDVLIEEYVLKLEYIVIANKQCLVQIERDLKRPIKKQNTIDELEQRKNYLQSKCEEIEKKIQIAREEIVSRNKKNR